MSDRPMYETAAALMAAEIRGKVGADAKAEEVLEVAFKNAYNHWMFTEEMDQFKGAIGAALMTLKNGPEFDRINTALRSFGQASAILNALQAGVPIDFDSMEKPDENAPPVIPLNQMWCDVKWPERA